MFFGGAVISQENQKYINKNKIEKEKRCVQLKKLMDDYINHMADHPRISFSGMMYYGKLTDGIYEAGIESSEVRLFNKDEIPWQDIAFTVIEKTIKFYYEDVEKGNIDIHFDTIIKK